MAGDYISREAALMKLMQDGCSAKNLQSISDMPAADVAEVVRCKDCKHWQKAHRRCRQPKRALLCSRNMHKRDGLLQLRRVFNKYKGERRGGYYCSGHSALFGEQHDGRPCEGVR